jgi:peptidoglycan/xylan/chitin deacetylase (PgdA/CDA1 family)
MSQPRVSRLSRPTRQALVGLLALPLSLLPFWAYSQFTPQGGLLAAQVEVAVAPPHLPEYDAATLADLRVQAPQWSGLAAVLVYHGMGASGEEQQWTISTERFADQLATMKASGMNPITASELAAARTGGEPLPDNAVLVTFDDGRTDAFLWADPLLEEAGWRASMFVITYQASRNTLYYQDWDAMGELAGTGRWDIQSHGADMHDEQEVGPDGTSLPVLTSLGPDESIQEYESRVRTDMASSSAAITDYLGSVPTAYAYPFGAYGKDRTNHAGLQPIVADAVGDEYTLGFVQDDQESVPLTGCSGDPLLVRRLDIGDWSGGELMDRLTEMADERASRRATPCPS